MFPVPPTAGWLVTVPWLIAAVLAYNAPPPGTFAVTRLVAEKTIGQLVGLKISIFTWKREVWPVASATVCDL